jgi:hypothetical protein
VLCCTPGGGTEARAHVTLVIHRRLIPGHLRPTSIRRSLVVLAAWELTDPYVWERKVTSRVPLETYGQCNSLNNGVLAFGMPLTVLIVVTVLIIAALSWKLRGVQSDLAESHLIFAGIFLHIQTWLVGGPVLYITNSVSKDASYLMMVSLTCTLSTSMVLLIIGPKMFAWAKSKGFCVCSFFNDVTTTRISIDQKGPKTHISGLAIPSSGNQTTNANTVESSYVKLTSMKLGSLDSRDFNDPELHMNGLRNPCSEDQNNIAMPYFCSAQSPKVDDDDSRDRIAILDNQVSQLQTELNNALQVVRPEQPGIVVPESKLV